MLAKRKENIPAVYIIGCISRLGIALDKKLPSAKMFIIIFSFLKIQTSHFVNAH